MLCCPTGRQVMAFQWPYRQVFPKLVAIWDPPCWEAAAQQAALQQFSLEVSASPEAQLLVRMHALAWHTAQLRLGAKQRLMAWRSCLNQETLWRY